MRHWGLDFTRTMRRLAAALVVLGALTGAGSALAIIGGTPDTAHPYVGAAIQVQNGGHEICSGFLVSPTEFVTAAHCFPPGSTAYVSFDQNALTSTNAIPGIVYDDPLWCSACGNGLPNADTHDLAVIILEQPVQLTQYAALPSAGLADTLKNTQVDVVGYGIQGFTSKGVPSAFGERDLATTKVGSAGVLGNEFIKIGASPGICLGDSGGPNLLAGTNIVVAETTFQVGKPGCTGNSYSERLDTPDALAFINGGYLTANG